MLFARFFCLELWDMAISPEQNDMIIDIQEAWGKQASKLVPPQLLQQILNNRAMVNE